jgi:hypothetical protein
MRLRSMVPFKRTRKAFVLATTVVLAVTISAAAASPAQAATVSAVELWPRHTLSNTGGHMCVDVAHQSHDHAAPIVQADCWGGWNQRFWLEGKPDGSFLIHPAHTSNKCLDVAHMSTQHGAQVLQADCTGTDNQRWFEVGGNGFFQYRPKHSLNVGKVMCLDVANMSLAHGTPVIQGSCWGGMNQQFAKVHIAWITV